MRILVGTTEGLARLDGDGHLEWLLKGEVSAVDREWAIVDQTTIANIETTEPPATTPWPARCLVATATGAVIGTAEAHLLELRAGSPDVHPIASFDEIPTRGAWYTPWGAPPDTRSIAVTADGTPLVNVHVGGVWRGAADGWQEVVDVDRDTHQILAVRDGSSTVVAAAAVGFGQSADDGRTFEWTTDGLHDTYCRAVAVADDLVLVTASTGPFTEHGAVYVRALDGPGPFVRCDNGLPEWFPFNIDTFQLAARGSDVVLGTDGGEVFVSQDGGASWKLALDELGPVRCVSVGWSANPGHLD